MAQYKAFFEKIWKFARTKWGIVSIVTVVLLGGYFLLHKKTSPQTTVTVRQGSITETVSVTGNSTPTQSVSLGFGNSGTIALVTAAVGDHVYAGEVLAGLNSADLLAILKQQQAQLDSLKAGNRPEDIAVSQAALAKVEQDLLNIYGQFVNSTNDAYAKANDAVRTQIGTFFSNAENNTVTLNFNTSNSQAAIDAKSKRVAMGSSLDAWQKEFALLSALPTVPELDTLLKNSMGYLVSARSLLNSVSVALNSATSLDTTTLAGDKTELATAVSEVNTAIDTLNTLAQNVASQKLTVQQAQAALTLKQAGSSVQDIAAQQAVVESTQAKLANSTIISPINGVITQCDAKVGQFATIGSPLISVISTSQFEVDAQVPETDIGKIAIGNSVLITFDAFPNEAFNGKLFYIDPAQTVNQGVVNYKIKVSFDSSDTRMKSGLTANLTIKTKTDSNVLIVPQYAVLQNDKGTFVEKLINGVATETPVTIGIQDQNGNVEVLSGVVEGEQILNIGLK